jgi:hypothetical protein
MVVALAALSVALAGTAYAASLPRNSVGNRQLKNNAVTSSKVKNDSLTGRDVKESTLGIVPRAAALKGLRYARINSDGTVDRAHSLGITTSNVNHPHTGIYCFTGISGAHVIQATAETVGVHFGTTQQSGDFIATARLGAPAPGLDPNCPANSSADVQVAQPRASSGVADSTYTYDDTDRPFYVVIY